METSERGHKLPVNIEDQMRQSYMDYAMSVIIGRALPDARDGLFWLDSSAWEIPTYENADTFVERLMREGLLAHDPVVSAALQGQTPAYSPRALQYHFVRATGMPHKVIQQISRAHEAAALLGQGTATAEIALALGYFDQSHLTNALKRFLGQTPTQIRRDAGA